MFELKISKLTENRKILNNSNNFEEISKVWNEIKVLYEACKNEINDIKNKLNKLNIEKNINISDINLSFEQAYKEIKDISEKIKECSISDMPKYLERLILLKTKCLTILQQEKAKIEEVK